MNETRGIFGSGERKTKVNKSRRKSARERQRRAVNRAALSSAIETIMKEAGIGTMTMHNHWAPAGEEGSLACSYENVNIDGAKVTAVTCHDSSTPNKPLLFFMLPTYHKLGPSGMGFVATEENIKAFEKRRLELEQAAAHRKNTESEVQVDEAWIERKGGRIISTEKVPTLPNSVMKRFDRMTSIMRAQREDQVEKFIDAAVAETPLLPAMIDLQKQNAQARIDYINRVPAYRSSEIREMSPKKPVNKSEPAAGWKKTKRVFAVKIQGKDYYPAFQFEAGEPKPLIKKVLKALPSDMSQWQIAYWFDSANTWLDGKSPAEQLDKQDDVLRAASMQSETLVYG